MSYGAYFLLEIHLDLVWDMGVLSDFGEMPCL